MIMLIQKINFSLFQYFPSRAHTSTSNIHSHVEKSVHCCDKLPKAKTVEINDGCCTETDERKKCSTFSFSPIIKIM